MQFRLVYEGPLRANGNARHKQEIRRALHPQLRDLWTHEPLAENRDWLESPGTENRLSLIHNVGNFRYAPAKELVAGDAPKEGEDPFFCLLDDDERITDLHVATDRYLAAPNERSVHVTLFVRTRPTKVIYGNLPLA